MIGTFDRDFGKAESVQTSLNASRRYFWATKRFLDVAISLTLIVPFGVFCLLLLVLNPWYNRGPLFYTQIRMGKDCRAFRAIKFRSMVPVSNSAKSVRRHNEGIEHSRITRLGGILRKLRIDELPQILNVLRGDMSLIGPRPDTFSHAKVFCRTVPGYAARHLVRPGISGLAQVKQGYAVGIDATRMKTAYDLAYIQSADLLVDLRLVGATIVAVFSGRGV